MHTLVYKTYRFDFDKQVYVREFSKALREHGITKPAQFHRLLKKEGIVGYDYETVKSYYYGRRVPPLGVFFAVCKGLQLCADQIAFAQSVASVADCGDISDYDDCFRNVFHPYNAPRCADDIPNLTEYFCEQTYRGDTDRLALVLSKYHYLIQKYHYASVSNDELTQITQFTRRYIIDRESGIGVDYESVLAWIRNDKSEAFLETFYSRYTIGYYGKSCRVLLDALRDAIPSELILYAEQLLPDQDRAVR